MGSGATCAFDWVGTGSAASPLSDRLVGATEIDLEDRWFDAGWRQLGVDGDGSDATSLANGQARPPRWPLERRRLWSPAATQPQGSLAREPQSTQRGSTPRIDPY